MHLEKEKGRAPSRGMLPLLGWGLASMVASAALAKTVPFAGGQFTTNDHAVSGKGGEFAQNVSIRSLQLGDRTVRLDEGRFRAPVQVRMSTGESASPSADSATLELTPDLPPVAGMTALDAMSGADLGRMIRTDGTKPTRVQVFLSMQERDDDAFADDAWPEVVLIGAPDMGTVRVTPILDGTPDVPATMVFGTPHEVSAATLAKGLMPLRIDYNGRKAPQALAAVGLDLSGDLGVAPGQTVVGYQIDVPAGCSTPLKVISTGQVDFGAYANFMDAAPSVAKVSLGQFSAANPSLNAAEDLGTMVIGPVFIGSGKSVTTDNQFLPDGAKWQIPETLGFQDTGSTAFNTPPVMPVPGPGAAALLAMASALGLGGRRRR